MNFTRSSPLFAVISVIVLSLNEKILTAMTQLTLDNADASSKLIDFDQTLVLSERDTLIGPCLNTSVQEAIRCSSALR